MSQRSGKPILFQQASDFGGGSGGWCVAAGGGGGGQGFIGFIELFSSFR